MITLTLEWREVLWWMQGGMAGSHLRWSVYEDMVNKVWPQCSEQERRNLWYVMRRDPAKCITDLAPWNYFRQVLARFDPENQYAVTMPVTSKTRWENTLHLTPEASIISRPNLSHFKRDEDWQSDTATVTFRAYKWQYPEGHDAYFIDWRRRCDPDRIAKVEKLEIPDDGTM